MKYVKADVKQNACRNVHKKSIINIIIHRKHDIRKKNTIH